MQFDVPDLKACARMVRLAEKICGGRAALAAKLEVQHWEIAVWTEAKVFPPQAVFEQIVEIVLDAHERRTQRPLASTSVATPPGGRVLIANSADGAAVLSGVLGAGIDSVAAHSRTRAIQILHTQDIALVVCDLHFDDSQMLRFLEHLKADERTRGIPFIGCRVTRTQLGDMSLAATRAACEALGALAYIDLLDSTQPRRREARAVEFRDAVLNAMRPNAARASRHVLIADGNPDASHTLGMVLEMAGHKVYSARNGEEAIEAAREFRPHVSILDLAIPKVSGVRVAEHIRRHEWGDNMILVAMTGYSARATVATALLSGFDYYFRKPLDPQRLFAVFPT